MKKILIIGVLVLIVVTSMVAGTLAIYNNTITLSGQADALRFYIGATETKEANLELAPGTSDTYAFTVTNVNPSDNAVTEVPMDLTITTTVPQGFGEISVKLELGDQSIIGEVVNGVATFNFNTWSEANSQKTATGTLTYTWVDNGEANQYDIGGGNNNAVANSGFTVTVTGTQHVGN